MIDPADNLTIDMYDNNDSMPYDYETFARECYLFNELTGQADRVTQQDLLNQVSLIYEELNETQAAIRSFDEMRSFNPVETLDGLVDVLVTAIGLAQKLENKGYDVTTAMKRVAENNLSKFVTTQEAAHITVLHYMNKGVECYVEKHDSGLYAIKRKMDDKLMKPVGYQSVDLSDLV